MKVFPIIKGKQKLNTSKRNFISKLIKLTEKDIPLISIIGVSRSENLKEYAREFYDDSFILWKIPPSGVHSKFIFTTIHCSLIENKDCITFKYCIRFNIWSNILIIGLVLCSLFLLYDNIFLSNHFDLKSYFIILIPYPLFMWIFKDCASDDKKFIEKLTT